MLDWWVEYKLCSCGRSGDTKQQKVEFSLQYIHGIGRTTAKQILVDLGMDNKFTKDLSEEELTSLREEVTQYMIEGDLVCFSFPFQLMPEGTFFFLLSVEGSIFLFSVFFLIFFEHRKNEKGDLNPKSLYYGVSNDIKKNIRNIYVILLLK